MTTMVNRQGILIEGLAARTRHHSWQFLNNSWTRSTGSILLPNPFHTKDLLDSGHTYSILRGMLMFWAGGHQPQDEWQASCDHSQHTGWAAMLWEGITMDTSCLFCVCWAFPGSHWLIEKKGFWMACFVSQKNITELMWYVQVCFAGFKRVLYTLVKSKSK